MIALLFFLLFAMALDSVSATIAQQFIASGTVVDPLSLAFGKQREAIACRAPRVVLTCSGRAGKTRGFLLKWLEVKERKPGQISVFVALTRQSAERIAWNQLKQLNKDHGLGLEFNESDLTCSDARGSQLILLGANRDDLIDVLRGFPIVLIGFDEAAFFRSGLLERAYRDAVLARLMDYDGECWIMSTPGYVLAGYHFEIQSGRSGEKWRAFHWTYFDNPHLPAGPEWLLKTAREKWDERVARAKRAMVDMGWDETTPQYVREFLGLYKDDPDSRVYKFSRALHSIQAMPESWTTERHLWTRVLGVDYGSTNAFAMTLLAFKQGSPVVYIVRAKKWYERSPSETADLTNEWVIEYAPDVIVGDSAAKGYIDEARVRHQLPIENADKLGKLSHQRWMNDAFTFKARVKGDDGKEQIVAAPRLYVVEPDAEDFCSEAERLGKNPKRDRHHPKYGEEDPRAENDSCDSALYGYVRCYAYLEAANTNGAEDGDNEEPIEDVDDDAELAHERRRRRANAG